MLGEDTAAGLLERKGMRVLARNWRCRVGELDLVAMDGSTLVFVEVKCRSCDRLYDPALAVDARKQTRVRRVAEAYMAMERPHFADCRFDVVSVVAGNPVTLTHLVAAF
jgi:putative endonuclease